MYSTGIDSVLIGAPWTTKDQLLDLFSVVDIAYGESKKKWKGWNTIKYGTGHSC